MYRDTLIKEFRERFGGDPNVLISAPGRVNLIGEHTDYNGFPVLPVSIPFAIRAAASARPDGKVFLVNRNSEYPPRTFTIEKDIPYSPPGDWSNYVKAAVWELARHSRTTLRGMNVLFDGDIPASAGLSSSSALVIASALALLETNALRRRPNLCSLQIGEPYKRIELAEMMAEGERYVGTQGGGMDQAICLLGEEGKALRIDFFPLRYSPVEFPSGCSIVVAHSLIRAAKTENALLLYNRRPAECRLATTLINSIHAPIPPLSRLGDLPRYDFFARFSACEEFVDYTFPEEAYPLELIARFCGESEQWLAERCLMTRSGNPIPEPPDGFRIRQRVLHILTEAERVEKSCGALKRNDAAAFGELMNESHRSCDLQYDISTPELNTLTSIMREAGALGARLTGAGFGGCAIALAHDTDIERIAAAVRDEYYGKYLSAAHPGLAGAEILFTAKPSRGATVENLLS
jgi:N-acetylgalactosamine kinase